jgi:hypothetical protein
MKIFRRTIIIPQGKFMFERQERSDDEIFFSVLT